MKETQAPRTCQECATRLGVGYRSAYGLWLCGGCFDDYLVGYQADEWEDGRN